MLALFYLALITSLGEEGTGRCADRLLVCLLCLVIRLTNVLICAARGRRLLIIEHPEDFLLFSLRKEKQKKCRSGL